jgi:hypothetical protein
VDERHVRLKPATSDGVGAVAMPAEPVYVATTHDDDGWMGRSLAERFGWNDLPVKTFNTFPGQRFQSAMRPNLVTARPAMIRPNIGHRGTSRALRARPRRTAVRSGSRGDPPRSADDDPEDDDLVRTAGVAA